MRTVKPSSVPSQHRRLNQSHIFGYASASLGRPPNTLRKNRLVIMMCLLAALCVTISGGGVASALELHPQQTAFLSNRQHHRIQVRGASSAKTKLLLSHLPPSQISMPIFTKSSSTSLNLFFDNFVRPYGVPPPNNRTDNDDDDDEMNQTRVELLDALLPRRSSPGDKSRALEAFQRARLAEQLRISKQSQSRGNQASSDSFQRALLEEQLRLHLKQKQFQQLMDENTMKEADSLLRMTMVQEEDDSDDGLIDGQENAATESFVAEGSTIRGNDDTSKSSTGTSASASSAVIVGDDGNNNAKHLQKLMVNGTGASAKNLLNKLDALKHMAHIATTASSAVDIQTPSSQYEAINETTTNVTASPLQQFLSTTYLPMPPREDASTLSLVLAPFAHMLTSIVLFGTAGVYAVCAIIDVLCNDNDADSHDAKNDDETSVVKSSTDSNSDTNRCCSTRSCLREAALVWRSCWDHVFVAADVQNGPLQRTLEALQTSIVAFFYSTKVVVVRAARHSRYADECLDAGTSALRYCVYSLRSVKVLWQRLLVGIGVKNRTQSIITAGGLQSRTNLNNIATESSTAISENENKSHNKGQKFKRKVDLFRIVSHIQKSAAQRRNQQHSLQLQQKNIQAETSYKEKMVLLNSDRVSMERERREIFEERQQLEKERRKLLCEGVGMVAWFAAVNEAQAAAAVEEKEEKKRNDKKKTWGLSWWGRRGEEETHPEERTWEIDLKGNDDSSGGESEQKN